MSDADWEVEKQKISKILTKIFLAMEKTAIAKNSIPYHEHDMSILKSLYK